MKIAICDDDKRELQQIAALVENYRKERKAELTCVVYQSATELLVSMGRTEYDVLLLDVMMPGVNGIQAAREIRDSNDAVEIVFLTSSPEFAVESYTVRAYHYLLKPLTKDKLYPILDKLSNHFKDEEAVLHVKSQTSIFNVPYSKIEYVEVNAKTLYFHLTDGSIRAVYGSLSLYEKQLLSRPGFLRVHRSYLVNLSWVRELRQKELLMESGGHVPISRSAGAAVRTAYTRFLFHESAVESTKG